MTDTLIKDHYPQTNEVIEFVTASAFIYLFIYFYYYFFFLGGGGEYNLHL